MRYALLKYLFVYVNHDLTQMVHEASKFIQALQIIFKLKDETNTKTVKLNSSYPKK